MTALSVPIGDIDLASTLRTLAFLPGDPSTRLSRGRFERATVTPHGVGTIVVSWRTGESHADVETHGDGAAWLLERAPRLLGCTDDIDGFAPATEPVRDLWRRHRGDRITRTGTLWHDLAWFVVQQRIASVDAAAQWRRLVTDLGIPAPGPTSLVAPPDPEVIARTAYHHFHRYGIERQHAENLRRAAHAAIRGAASVDEPADVAVARLRSVRGVGPWTAGWLAAQTWGDRDTVIVGDHGIPSNVAWLLARERQADDQRLIELLEPYRPHRQRVIRLAFASGARPPRRHPRARRQDIRRR